MLWHEQSWSRLDQLDRSLPVVVPLGSCEQHGRHLPLFVDSIQVESIARKAETAMPEGMLLLPNIWLGSSHDHLGYTGTISLPPPVFMQVIQAVAAGILDAGFKRILFLNGHGGNRAPATSALTELAAARTLSPDAYLVLSTWWDLARTSASAAEHGVVSTKFDHACEFETSCLLHLRSDLVDQAELARLVAGTGSAGSHYDEPWLASPFADRLKVFCPTDRRSATGAFGWPERATDDKGQSIITSAVQELQRFLRDFATWGPTITRRRGE